MSFLKGHFSFLACLSLFAFAGGAFAQQPVSSDAKPAAAAAAPVIPSPAPSHDAKPSSTQPPVASTQPPAQQPTVPGLDPKTLKPLYETIQEDWSSLQIGASKLEPQPPVPGEYDDTHPTFIRSSTQLQWRPGDPIDLWIVTPKNVKQPPVVIYLYGPDADKRRFRDDTWATHVTAGGVAAVAFYPALVGPRFHDRPLKQNIFSEMQEALGSTVHDVKFVLDYLASTGKFDMNRVGIFGAGWGGSIAILSAAGDSRIKAVDALEPWGDWPVFLAKSPLLDPDPDRAAYAKPEFLEKVAPLDPVKWLPDLKIPVRIQQIHETEVSPEECKDAIQAAAPKQTELVRFATLADIGRREGGGRLFEWVKEKLQPAPGAGSARLAVAEKPADARAVTKN